MTRNKLFGSILAAALVVGAAGQAQAAILTIYDNGTDNTQPSPANAAAIWTLNIAEGCQVCAATFSVEFTNLLNNPYFAQDFYLDSVQFTLAGTVITAVSETSNTTGTTWTWDVGKLNANQCNSTGSNAACAEYAGGSASGGFDIGGSPVTYSWSLNVTFSELIESFGSGNIRAAFNDAEGDNLRIFSPSDGTFDGGDGDDGGQDGGGAPEPGMLLLLGTGLVLAGARLRKRQ